MWQEWHAHQLPPASLPQGLCCPPAWIPLIRARPTAWLAFLLPLTAGCPGVSSVHHVPTLSHTNERWLQHSGWSSGFEVRLPVFESSLLFPAWGSLGKLLFVTQFLYLEIGIQSFLSQRLLEDK
jgi:hypothetical protein